MKVTIKELEFALNRKNLYNVNLRIRCKLDASGSSVDLSDLLKKTNQTLNCEVLLYKGEKNYT